MKWVIGQEGVRGGRVRVLEIGLIVVRIDPVAAVHE